MSALLRAAFILLGWLPLPCVHGIATVLGVLAWVIPNQPDRISRRHLELCLPELGREQRSRIARRSLTHSLKAMLEAPSIWFGPEFRLRRWLADAPALAQLRQLQAAGRGVIVLCPHLGSWELAGMLCAAAGPMTSLYKPQPGVVDELIREGRARLGARLVPTDTGGVKALLSALRRGEMIGILPDHDPPAGSGAFALLFGIPAHTTVLVSRLAARSGAAVCFCIAERRTWGRGFRFHIQMAPAEIADQRTGVAVLNRSVEQRVRELPEQYWWSYRRYRRQPEGGRDVYLGT
jgi:KDO2-lipid IV(A) lauroyltransferase